MLTTLVSLVVALFVFAVTLSIVRVLREARERYRARYATRALSDPLDWVMLIEPGQIRTLNGVVAVLAGVLGWVILNPMMGVLAGVLGFWVPSTAAAFLKRKRVRAFNAQLAEALLSVSHGLKAGLSLQQSLEMVARSSQPPLGDEFGLLIKELKLGSSVEQAFGNLSVRVQSEDLDLMVVATHIARQVGGNLAELFQTLSESIRERFRLEGKMDALTSQGKLQGWVVSAMPLLLGAAFHAIRPDLIRPMMEHAFGWSLLALVLVLEAMGFLLIRRIVRVEI
jgi:tight adherence protein B